MNGTQLRIKELIEPLFKGSGKIINPASKEEIEEFKKIAKLKDIPEDIITQLVEFYQITKSIPGIDGFDFHKINDVIIYEWWDLHQELWLGQRDFNTLRWSKHKKRFCLGDGSNVSFSEAYEYNTLIELLETAFKEFYLNN